MTALPTEGKQKQARAEAQPSFCLQLLLCRCALLLCCCSVQDKLVRQQLGPAPPATASPGMILQYNTMFNERKRSLAIDNVNGLIESAAALLVKVCADTS